MITADQLLAHLIGDYVLQSNWMATEKIRDTVAAAIHAFVYTAVFLIAFQPGFISVLVIGGTHFLIDRYRMARYVVWLKNWIGCGNRPWSECKNNGGFTPDVPVWLSSWLVIIVDNVLHLTINGAALRWQ